MVYSEEEGDIGVVYYVITDFMLGTGWWNRLC
jgi:hypothetical protein